MADAKPTVAQGLAFRMIQLCVLTEIKKSELWIPIPQMYGVSNPFQL
jgi:hypothetical protein